MSPDGLPPLREVIRELELSAKKSFSQNFILDFNLTRRIARAGGPLEGVTVVEVGPGPGGLTRALLLEGAERVIAIEMDERCRPALEQIGAHYPGRLQIIMADALTVDFASLVPPGAPARAISNLPYSVATPLLVNWLKSEAWPPWYDNLVLMFQREVAERIVSEPYTKAYGRLAILCQWRTSPRILFNVAPQAFTPPPKVSSSVVLLTPTPVPLPLGNVSFLEETAAAAFGQRRKMLRSSLKPLFSDTEGVLRDLGIEATRRAEELSIAEFCRLAESLEQQRRR
jgi:16S rRNA (adenine1518-N6/adenine1519-N6)-dimethyltransferase